MLPRKRPRPDAHPGQPKAAIRCPRWAWTPATPPSSPKRCKSSATGSPATPGTPARRWQASPATAPATPASCAPTWTASYSCPQAITARPGHHVPCQL